MYAMVRKVLVVVLASLLAVPMTLAGGAVAPVVPDDLEGVILDSVPAEWGDLVSPVPTQVPGLYVVVAQPYLALDPRADSFRARWEDAAPNPLDTDAVGALLQDPALQGATMLVLGLVETSGPAVSLLAYTEVQVQNGEYVRVEPQSFDRQEFREALHAWRASLLRRIYRDDRLRDERFAAEVAWYTIMSDDSRVAGLWAAHLMGPGEDCSKSVQSPNDCEDCCTGQYFWNYFGCYTATGLTAGGVCLIAAACGPFSGACCEVAGSVAVTFVVRNCFGAVDDDVKACTTTCKKGLEVQGM